MAEVWEAHDDVLRRRVAVKLFESRDDTDARRSAAEMHTLAALDHPALVTVHDAGTDGDRSFLVMELVDGETLADRLRRGPLERAEAAALGAQVAAGLAHIHARGIVHRDVKPANLLLPTRAHDDGPTVKLADFGIAQQVGSERLTRTGMTIGTAAYLAPEQVTGKPVTPAADVYALGLVLLEALGRAPDWSGSPVEIAVARLSTPPTVPDDLGPTWTPLLRAMTAAEPGARPTAARVREVLTAAAAGTEVVDASAPGATSVLPAELTPTELLPSSRALVTGRRRSRLVLAGLLALGLAAVAVVLAVALGGSPPASAPAGGTPAPSPATSPATSSAPTTLPPTTPAPTTDTPTAADTPTAPAGPGDGNGPGGGKGPGGGPGKPEKSKPGKH